MRTLKIKSGGLAFLFFSKPQHARPVSRSELEAPLQVSGPTDFKRVGHISYRAATGVFSGLDAPVVLFFGVSIASQPRVDVPGYDDRIPSILVLLGREMMRRGGLYMEGIFRVPATSESIAESRTALNLGKGTTALEAEESPHLFACLIKDWFRSLPAQDTLLSALTVADISALSKETSSPQETLERVLSALPEPKRSIFKWILNLLSLVCHYGPQNRMGPSALATVFSPSLTQPPLTMDSFAIVSDTAKVIEKCIIAVLSGINVETLERAFMA